MDEREASAFGGQLDALRTRIEGLRREERADVSLDTLLAELESAHEELRVADEEVRAQQEELEDVLRSQRSDRWLHERLVALLPVAVVVTDDHGLVRTANATAGALLNVGLDRLVRKPVFAFVDSRDRSDLRGRLAKAVGAMDDFRCLATVRPRHGRPVTVEVDVTPRRSVDTATVEVTWVLLPTHDPSEVGPHRRDSSLARALAALTHLASTNGDKEEVLTEVAKICERALPRPVAASVGIGDPAEPDVVATGSELAQYADRAQMTSGEGPSHTAWSTRTTVHTGDLQGDERWPRLRHQLRTNPVHTAVAIPLETPNRLVGVLSLYGEDDSLTAAEVLEDVELLGGTIAVVLGELDTKRELESAAEQLTTALESRATIDQAKGMIMGIRGCGPDEAFAIMAQISSDRNVKVRDLAARMVGRASQGTDSLPDQRRNGGRGQGPGLDRPPSP